MKYQILDLVNGEFLKSKDNGPGEYEFDSEESVEEFIKLHLEVIDVLFNTGKREKMNVLGTYFSYKPIREHYEIIEIP